MKHIWEHSYCMSQPFDDNIYDNKKKILGQILVIFDYFVHICLCCFSMHNKLWSEPKLNQKCCHQRPTNVENLWWVSWRSQRAAVTPQLQSEGPLRLVRLHLWKQWFAVRFIFFIEGYWNTTNLKRPQRGDIPLFGAVHYLLVNFLSETQSLFCTCDDWHIYYMRVWGSSSRKHLK